MADSPDSLKKSSHAEREERILKFWKDKDIFKKSLDKEAPKGEFVFYEGPPTANGRPGIHHLEARAFKDVIPRFRTMRGYHVRRKGGWDTHGLPVELQVEKDLGLKSKKEIESYGIEKFNDKCKESVWTYVREWEDFTNRMGYWVDLKDPYITYKPEYMESLWNIVKTVDKKGLLYKDYKVVPWCPRCGTALSSHELAQGYADVKDLAVTVKFKLKAGQKIGDFTTDDKTYILAWTTTPWTLPGNVGLAVGKNIIYNRIELNGEQLIASHDAIVRLDMFKTNPSYKVIEKGISGFKLVGLEYEPLYPFLKDSISGAEKEKLPNAYKVYLADFVTTEDGTGVVHTAVMYGQDDFELGVKVGLPKYHLVNEDGTFKKEAGFLAGKFVKDEATDVEIIKDLAHRGLLFHKEKHEHSYPFCWRCQTPLIYFARDSWYIGMSRLRDKLVKENESIHWEPEHIKEGRFGEWLREVKDWAFSRERYWGTPLPVWVCDRCGAKKVAGSVADVSRKPRNTYYVMRHGEAGNNAKAVLNYSERDLHPLTEKGRGQVRKSAEGLKGAGIDAIYCSPFIRARETAQLAAEAIGLKKEDVKIEERLREFNMGDLDGEPISRLTTEFPDEVRFDRWPEGGESYADIKKRMGSFLYEMEEKHQGKTILIVSHETPLFLLISAAEGLDRKQTLAMKPQHRFISNAEVRKLEFTLLPHDAEYELDLHRPYIDEVRLPCACGGEMRRVKEVMDVWFDSGAMPFAQDHYPFEGKRGGLLGRFGGQKLAYPADFISEAIDQTRGWFYTLHAVGVLMGRGKAFKNVICLGLILDAEGKKMSKSVGNVIDPAVMMDRYGADALRFWMYSINQPGESKNFEEKTVDEVVKKVFNLISNTTVFYKMYAKADVEPSSDSENVLDRWIVARLNQLVADTTKNLDDYILLEPARAIRDFAADLSQWYLRRSRGRFKGEGSDKQAALATTKYVLLTLAKVMAPFTPFFAEELYRDVGGEKESVHLEDWPEAGLIDKNVLIGMSFVRSFASMALMQRMENKIPVRQPLLKIKHKGKIPDFWNKELEQILMDEVNVKAVVFDGKMSQDDPPVKLDTTITPELKEEGGLRELLRRIQDLRKEKGLSVNDPAILTATGDLKDLISKHEREIKAATHLTEIRFGDSFELKT